MAKKKKDAAETPAEPSDGSIAVNDAWTGMLAVSFLALAIGAGFLLYDYLQYDSEKVPTVPKFTQSPPGPQPKGPQPKVDPVKDAGAKDAKDAKDEKKEPEKKGE